MTPQRNYHRGRRGGPVVTDSVVYPDFSGARSARESLPTDPEAVGAAIDANQPETTPTMRAVGALVRRLRDDARLSLARLAAAAELSPGLLSQIERGMGNPSFTTLIKLAH